MNELASVLTAVLGIFQMEFTISGFTFSLSWPERSYS